MDNNINPEMINNIKNLVDNGNLSDAISQIPPEMIENFSKMFNSNNETNNKSSSQTTYNQNNSSFDFSNLDMNTILKIIFVIKMKL